MNFIQFLSFSIFVFSMLLAGFWFINLLKLNDKLAENKGLLIGEALIGGGIKGMQISKSVQWKVYT